MIERSLRLGLLVAALLSALLAIGDALQLPAARWSARGTRSRRWTCSK
jgi:hypothetical protein